jgi:tRNA pseudouridine38-40 synthase
MRYFAHLSYNGKNYNGWQIQKNSDRTIQATIEEALFIVSRTKTPIIGCGRTDTGVHALQYFIHFDSDFAWNGLEYKLNKILPPDIVIYKINQVGEECHARFDALSRAYQYQLHTFKNAFNNEVSYFYKKGSFNLGKANKLCALIMDYEEFFPFCKSKSGVDHYKCNLKKANWTQRTSTDYVLDIEANRFLRGMVRLIVGACILVSEDKLTIDQVKNSLDNQVRLTKSLSAPPQGLFLKKIIYPQGITSLFQ